MNEMSTSAKNMIPAPVGDQRGSRDRTILAQWQRANRHGRVIRTLARINLRAMDRQVGLAKRAQHGKQHGCVEATFRIRDDLPPDLRCGFFATAGEHRALIRFSNGFKEDDRKADPHGMAVKVLGAATHDAAPPGAPFVQDFVLADHETFPSGEPRALVPLNQLLSGRGWTWFAAVLRLCVFHPRTLSRSFASLKKPSSLLDISYFSAIPYQLGAHAVKYVVAPHAREDTRAGARGPDGLREDLEETLRGGPEVIFDFGVDVRVDAETQPIEDPSTPWSAAPGSRRVWLAQIVIPAQDVARGSGFAENLAFSPWHAQPGHEPLGQLAEARREIYRELARHRHARNGIDPVGAAGAPDAYADGRPRRFSAPYWCAPQLTLLERLGGAWKVPLAAIAVRFPRFASLMTSIGPIQRASNWWTIDFLASKTAHRPLPLSLWTPDPDPQPDAPLPPYRPYVAWSGLVDRSFTGRHLPPIGEAEERARPDAKQIEPLFLQEGTPIQSDRTSVLFCFFAQWLTDSFLRTHPTDKRRNTSTQELDLCQIYGLGEEATRLLRTGKGGRLKSRETDVGELPPLLVDQTTLEVKPEFRRIAFDPIHATSFSELEPPHGMAGELRAFMKGKGFPPWAADDRRWRLFYAGGLERGNSTLFYSAFNTLFLREHNRLAGELQKRYAIGDDDWLFETARNINIVKYLKIIVEDYINHIIGKNFKIRLAQGRADRRTWYRANRITLEFNLLYRWHALVPAKLDIGNRQLTHEQFRFDNALIEAHGIEGLFDAASHQPAHRLQLGNTPRFLLEADMASLNFARQFRVAGFNAYRTRWGLKPYRSLVELTGDEALAKQLAEAYRTSDVDRVELPVGLLAETRGEDSAAVLPPLLRQMVASDAFSHALTNPLLAANVYGPDAFSPFGMEEIERFGREAPGPLGAERGLASLRQLVRDNCGPGETAGLASFDLHRGV